MTPAALIQKKRDGHELTREEVRAFVEGVVSGEFADYQSSALLMAVFFRGMTAGETVAFTQAMVDSGERYDLSSVPGPKIDKHSTGGVGDKVSLILAPLAAACGLVVPMMSGRGLGHSGGTLDKLESIAGFDVKLSHDRFVALLGKIGCAMIGQSEKIAPADKKLYALRDVTGTVECVPLIVASILSKKIAEGAQGLVIDVKVGSGAFMKTPARAKELARALTQTGRKLGLKCQALLTDMNQPLGYAVGNALEVREAIEVLKDDHRDDVCSSDLKELVVQLCARMLEMGGKARSLTEGRKLAHARLADGAAWAKFQDLVREQRGSIALIEDPDKLPKAPKCLEWKAKRRGYVAKMDTEALGRILVELGGGRKKASDVVDPAVGMIFHKKLGAAVKAGEPLVTVHAAHAGDLDALEERFQKAIEITGARKPVPKLILGQL